MRAEGLEWDTSRFETAAEAPNAREAADQLIRAYSGMLDEPGMDAQFRRGVQLWVKAIRNPRVGALISGREKA